MRRKYGVLGGLLVSAVLALATASATSAQTQPTPVPNGMMGGSGGTGGAGTTAPDGMMGGTGTSSGTTAPGAMMGGQGMMGGSGAGAQQATPLGSLDAAKQSFQGYVDRTGNRDLVLDEVMQFQWNYYAIVKEKSTGNDAFELLADPRTGAVFPEMGPNMMWNTRYSPMSTAGGMMGGFAPGGMMSGTWGPTAPATQPTVTADQSKQIAQQWLDQYQGGSATEAPDTFPGYYTLHITRDGTVSGMLSVNAYTGQVWFHTWHGAFVASSEM